MNPDFVILGWLCLMAVAFGFEYKKGRKAKWKQ